VPNSTDFGDNTESGQVIPVSLRGREGGYTHCMFLNDQGPIAAGPRALGLSEEAREPNAS
jgi:acetoacetate decarboxylase